MGAVILVVQVDAYRFDEGMDGWKEAIGTGGVFQVSPVALDGV